MKDHKLRDALYGKGFIEEDSDLRLTGNGKLSDVDRTKVHIWNSLEEIQRRILSIEEKVFPTKKCSKCGNIVKEGKVKQIK
jgi:hypothetical protein